MAVRRKSGAEEEAKPDRFDGEGPAGAMEWEAVEWAPE